MDLTQLEVGPGCTYIITVAILVQESHILLGAAIYQNPPSPPSMPSLSKELQKIIETNKAPEALTTYWDCSKWPPSNITSLTCTQDMEISPIPRFPPDGKNSIYFGGKLSLSVTNAEPSLQTKTQSKIGTECTLSGFCRSMGNFWHQFWYQKGTQNATEPLK